MQIKDLAIGDGYVYLMEDGTKVKFYALAHNYESGLNGNGRTLFCRESPATSGQRGTRDTSNTGDWTRCLEYAWYTSTYLNKFTTTVKAWLGETNYYCQYVNKDGDNYFETRFDRPFSTSSAIFALSVAEVTSSSRADGTLLSSNARTRLGKIYSNVCWLRSGGKSYTYTHNDSDGDRTTYWANGLYIGSSFSVAEAYKTFIGYLPCFTLPETLYIDKDGFPTVNQPPEITADAGESGVALGEKNAPFTVGYTVTDGNGDPMTITEKMNGVEMAVRENVATGTELTVQCLREKVLFQQILNGENALTLEVDDGKTTTEWTATFTKNVTRAVLSLAQPLTADDAITVAAMTLEGSFPADMSLTVELTNNALDEAPVWEKCTDVRLGESRAFVHHVFTNKTAARGFAFNYKITAARGASGVGGTITMIGGVIG